MSAETDRATQPTISFFEGLCRSAPEDPVSGFELASAYDWIGREDEAIPLYTAAIAAGLRGDRDRQARIQLGSSLRNVGRAHDAVQVLERAAQDYPHSASAACFLALALTDAGRATEAVSGLIQLLTRAVDTEDVRAYCRPLDSYAEDLCSADRP